MSVLDEMTMLGQGPGFQDFETFLLETKDLNSNNKGTIATSRSFRNKLAEGSPWKYDYTLKQIMSNYVRPLSVRSILTQYTADDEATDLGGDVTVNKKQVLTQVNFPVSFRLVKLIGAFNAILSNYEPIHRDQLAEDLMTYFSEEELLSSDDDMSVYYKMKSILKWVKVNSKYLQQLYRILRDWPIKTTGNFVVYTGFNFEVPNLGDYRESIIRELVEKGEGETIQIPFVLSTSISPHVAKRFANDPATILQIIIPSTLSVPYISNENSRELEVLLNMYGVYKKVSKDSLNPILRDVEHRVISLELVSFEEVDIRKLTTDNSSIIRDIISKKMSPDLPPITVRRVSTRLYNKENTRRKTLTKITKKTLKAKKSRTIKSRAR